MTRLPTGTPTRPVFQPAITWPSLNTVGIEWGRADDGQFSSKICLLRQITPTYLTTTTCPARTAGPGPLISVVTVRPAGGAVFGIVTAGISPGCADTVGRRPPPLLTCEPEALAVLAKV